MAAAAAAAGDSDSWGEEKFRGRARAGAGPSPRQALTWLALFRRRGHVLRGRPGAEDGGCRHRGRGPLGRRGRGGGRQGGCGLAPSRAGLPTDGQAGGLWAQGCRPGLRALGSGANLGPRRCPLPLRSPIPRARDGQHGLSAFLGEGGGRPSPNPSLSVSARAWILLAKWRLEVTAPAWPAHVQTW